MKKAAVVIGINKTQDSALPELKSAASGAKRVAAWLDNEGYDVKCLTDDEGVVSSSDVFSAIAGFARIPVQYDLLLVYFSGHGYWVSRADLWLLSHAPHNPNESINLLSSMDLGRYSGIPNLVFISDACRSIPLSRGHHLSMGSTAFPYLPGIEAPSKIDVFKATTEALPAYEVDLDGEFRSVLTHALMCAYREPTEDMVTRLETGSGAVTVVPNRKLETYLQHKVNDILAKVDISKIQRLDINVPSDGQVYIARVCQRIIDKSLGSPAQTRHIGSPVRERPEPFTVPDEDPGLTKKLIPTRQLDHFDSECGFVIQGAAVRGAYCTKGTGSARVEIADHGGKHETQALVRLWDVQPAVSVLLVLEDGRSLVLSSLAGYIGHAVIDSGGLMNVSYLPSRKNWRWGMVQGYLSEINVLRARIAQATDKGTFQLSSAEAANDLAQKIRVGKSIDPSMGLYAATAFAQASMEDKVRSVMDYMRRDIHADLFDIRLLASRDPGQLRGNDRHPLTPLCPMLTQNWHLLNTRGMQLPSAMEKARPYLANSLWTTFEAGATPHLIRAFQSGELQ